MYWTVQVLDRDGDPLIGKKVTTIFTSLLRGHLEEFTDEDGEASFGFDECDDGNAEIFVGGQKFGPYYIEDGDDFTVALD